MHYYPAEDCAFEKYCASAESPQNDVPEVGNYPVGSEIIPSCFHSMATLLLVLARAVACEQAPGYEVPWWLGTAAARGASRAHGLRVAADMWGSLLTCQPTSASWPACRSASLSAF